MVDSLPRKAKYYIHVYFSYWRLNSKSKRDLTMSNSTWKSRAAAAAAAYVTGSGRGLSLVALLDLFEVVVVLVGKSSYKRLLCTDMIDLEFYTEKLY